MFPHTRNIFLSTWLVCVLYLCIASPIAWSDSDKTIVDLERGRPEASSRYHRPRAEQRYQYDKTEVDLAVPLTHLRRHQPTHPSRRPSQAGIADGQLARQVQVLASGSALIALEVLL